MAQRNEHRALTVSLAQQTLQDPDARSCVRSAAGLAGSTCPVEAVPGSARPHVAGEPGYRTWTPNPDGTRVRCANPRISFGDVGRGSPYTYYHRSTERIEVGANWVRRHCPAPYAQACAERVNAAVERFER